MTVLSKFAVPKGFFRIPKMEMDLFNKFVKDINYSKCKAFNRLPSSCLSVVAFYDFCNTCYIKKKRLNKINDLYNKLFPI